MKILRNFALAPSPTISMLLSASASVVIFENDKYYLTNSIEWERLQSLPDNYTEGVSEGQRKNLAGNAWTVDVIAHIFTYLKGGESDA